jgi:hypothetical protein
MNVNEMFRWAGFVYSYSRRTQERKEKNKTEMLSKGTLSAKGPFGNTYFFPPTYVQMLPTYVPKKVKNRRKTDFVNICSEKREQEHRFRPGGVVVSPPPTDFVNICSEEMDARE